MPAKQIRGDYAQLAQIAQTFGTQADALKDAMQRLKANQGDLAGGDWIGMGASKFYDEMNTQVMPSMQRLVNALQQARQVTGEISRIVKQAEDDAAACFKLDGGSGSGGRSSGGEAMPAPQPGPTPTPMTEASQRGFSLKDLFKNFPEIPGWVKFLFDMGISFIPIVGDGLDLLQQAGNAILGKPVDAPVVVLSALGLVADAGWLDGPIPDPVDGANLGLAGVKAAIKAIPSGPARDAAIEILTKAAKNGDEMKRLLDVMGALGKNEAVLKALAKYPEGLHLLLRNGPEAVEFLAKNGDNAGQVFVDGQKFAEHFLKHADEFGHTTPQQYLDAARALTNSTEGVEQFVRKNGDTLFYRAETNEFAVLTKDGSLRTYFAPEDGRAYWLDQISGN